MTRLNASRIASRIANMRRLIEELHKGDMLRHQVETFLGMCQSGARSYTSQMRDSDIIEVANKVSSSRHEHPIYRLIASEDKIEQFLIDAANCDERKKKVSRVPAGPGRRFHLLADDEFHAVKVHRGPVAPDPWALPVAFFRAGVAG
jgi:hypothetical protein